MLSRGWTAGPLNMELSALPLTAKEARVFSRDANKSCAKVALQPHLAAFATLITFLDQFNL